MPSHTKYPDIGLFPVNTFLSSTYLDLKEHRKEIIWQLPRLEWANIICMEQQVAQPGPPFERCLEMVADSQIYIGLVGSRYGTEIQDEMYGRLSMTRHEYKHAKRLELYRIVLFENNGKNQDEINDKAQ